MVGVSAAVVGDRLPDILGHAADVSEQFTDRLAQEVGVPGHGLVQIVHVSLVVEIVVNLHRFLIDVRLQRIIIIGQLWQREALFVGGPHAEPGQCQHRGAAADSTQELASIWL